MSCFLRQTHFRGSRFEGSRSVGDFGGVKMYTNVAFVSCLLEHPHFRGSGLEGSNITGGLD